MTKFNGRYCTEYLNHPLCNPDFIYIDAPHQWGIENKIQNFTTAHFSMMPMMCDVLKFEHFLTPGTIIVTDGRTNENGRAGLSIGGTGIQFCICSVQ